MFVRVAAAQYPIDAIGTWEAYQQKLARWVGEAANNGAQLLVFPEYGAMELARIGAPEVWSDLEQSVDFVSGYKQACDDLHAELAHRHDVHILAASLPERAGDGRAYNVARLISPKGRVGEQRKLIMTRFERESWNISGGQKIVCFDTEIGMIGVAICYDVEFPLIVRAMSEAGAALILAPSCTDSLHGYHRVRVGAQARALENQLVVIQSPTIGEAPWSPAVDVNVGAAGVYGPPDLGFPSDGVIQTGTLNEQQWVYADIDLTAITRVRLDGRVLNFKHWREQIGATPLTAEVVAV